MTLHGVVSSEVLSPKFTTRFDHTSNSRALLHPLLSKDHELLNFELVQEFEVEVSRVPYYNLSQLQSGIGAILVGVKLTCRSFLTSRCTPKETTGVEPPKSSRFRSEGYPIAICLSFRAGWEPFWRESTGVPRS